MANELILPAFLQALVAKQDATTVAKFLPAVKSNALPARISTGGNEFTIIEADGEYTELQTKYMDCIIIAVADKPSRIYYAEKFDPKNPQKGPPTCFSDNGVGASENAADPQSNSCRTCPQAVWGSAPSVDGRGKPACQEGQKLAVLYEGNLYQLRLPPMSIKNWKTYVLYLEKVLREKSIVLIPSNVVTRVSFVSTGVLKFEAASIITDEINQQLQELDQNEIDMVLSKGDKVWEGNSKPVLSMALSAPELLSTAPSESSEVPKRRGRPPLNKDPVTQQVENYQIGARSLSPNGGTLNPPSAPQSVISFLDQAMGRK